MRLKEKDTSSGSDIREYACPACGYSDWEERGPALWQILSTDREEPKAGKADRAPAASGAHANRSRLPAGSWWKRLLARLCKSRERGQS